MDQSGIHIGDVGRLLRRMVDNWRLDERKGVRDRLRDFEDRYEKLESRETHAEADEFRIRLQDQFDLYKSSLDEKYAMIDEAHRQMIAYLERCGNESG